MRRGAVLAAVALAACGEGGAGPDDWTNLGGVFYAHTFAGERVGHAPLVMSPCNPGSAADSAMMFVSFLAFTLRDSDPDPAAWDVAKVELAVQDIPPAGAPGPSRFACGDTHHSSGGGVFRMGEYRSTGDSVFFRWRPPVADERSYWTEGDSLDVRGAARLRIDGAEGLDVVVRFRGRDYPAQLVAF